MSGHPVVPTPEGVSTETFRNVVAAAYNAWIFDHSWEIPAIKKWCKHTIPTVTKVVMTEEFKRSMAMRGVPVRDYRKSGLTAEQTLCIEVLTNAADRSDLRTRLKRVGISHSQYRAWLRQPLFRQAVTSLGESNLHDHLPSVLTALTNRAVSGDVNAAKFLLEVSGRHDPARRQAMDVQAMMMQVIDIITRNVKDPQVLENIANEMKMLSGAAGINAPSAVVASTVVDEPLSEPIEPVVPQVVHFELGE